MLMDVLQNKAVIYESLIGTSSNMLTDEKAHEMSIELVYQFHI